MKSMTLKLRDILHKPSRKQGYCCRLEALVPSTEVFHAHHLILVFGVSLSITLSLQPDK